VPGNAILPRLVRKYVELAEVCYRVPVTHHDRLGRFPKGHRGPRPHPALIKKADLDAALVQVYRRFFGTQADGTNSTSTSNSRCQGSETCSSPQVASGSSERRSEDIEWASGSSS